jgi:hypothetical protein
MTPLPQRKKTAEEIAKLRDQLGVPQSVDSVSGTPKAPAASGSPNPGASAKKNPEDRPHPPRSGQKAHPREAKHIEELARTSGKPLWLPAPTYPHLQQDTHATAASSLPVKRRSEAELEEMRSREMLAKMSEPPPTNIKFMAAHPALIGLGYLLAAIGVCGFWFETYPLPAIIAGSLMALGIAAYMALRRPVSRHHAGFISAISVLVGIFATIHHLPQLQHAP